MKTPYIGWYLPNRCRSSSNQQRTQPWSYRQLDEWFEACGRTEYYRSYILRHKSQLYMSFFKIRFFPGSCTLTTTTLSSTIEQLNTTRQQKSIVTSPEGVHIYFFLIGLLKLIYYQQGKIVEAFANVSLYLGYSLICLYPEYCFV